VKEPTAGNNLLTDENTAHEQALLYQALLTARQDMVRGLSNSKELLPGIARIAAFLMYMNPAAYAAAYNDVGAKELGWGPYVGGEKKYTRDQVKSAMRWRQGHPECYDPFCPFGVMTDDEIIEMIEAEGAPCNPCAKATALSDAVDKRLDKILGGER
jgi:hypothetical protein